MRRRELLAGLFATTAASALQAAEQNKVHSLAVCAASLEWASKNVWTSLFNRLPQIGFVEGKNLIIDRYTTDSRPEHYEEVVRKMVQAKPDVIALGFDHQLILQVARETSTIPIVATFGDPVAAGIVKNMARPERNITGVSLDAGIEMQGKHLEILLQAVPSTSRVAYLSDRAEWEGAWGLCQKRCSAITSFNNRRTAGAFGRRTGISAGLRDDGPKFGSGAHGQWLSS
jgi:putative ABC transport system substrate-binding protein